MTPADPEDAMHRTERGMRREAMTLMRKLSIGWLVLCGAVVLGAMVYVSGPLVVAGILAFSALTVLAMIYAAHGA
jgi:hypothetical protein